MRALPLCLLALSLTGCSMLQSKPSTTETLVKQPPPVTKTSPTVAPRPAPVKLYKSAEELVGKPFRDLGKCPVNLANRRFRTLHLALQPPAKNADPRILYES